MAAQFRCPTTSKFLASLLTSISPSIDTLAPSVNLPTITWSLRHIRSAITDDMAKSVASSLVCSRLDYANSLLYGTTQKNINRLQRVQNKLARVVAGHAVQQDTQSSGILKHLHWLPIEQRIHFRLPH